MRKCIVISDSFKGTLSSTEIASIAEATIPEIFPDCKVEAFAAADGGEGTVECFLQKLNGTPVTVDVSGPLPGSRIAARYGRIGHAAVIEMAAAAGMHLMDEDASPADTTTFGVGELICHAVSHGCKKIYLGLGGSGTNDGGCGCAAALGTCFYDAEGQKFIPVGRTLDRILYYDTTASDQLLSGVEITVLSDVTSPMWGPAGAAFVFAPQKGADSDETVLLDKNLRALDQVMTAAGHAVAEIPGAGAAGGMGAGCMAFLGASVCSGIETVLDLLDFDTHLEGADLVITGEGRIDGQSMHGKVISGVVKRAKAKHVPVICLAGTVDDSGEAAYAMGLSAIFSVGRAGMPMEFIKKRSGRDYRRFLRDMLWVLALGEQIGMKEQLDCNKRSNAYEKTE